MTIKRKPKTKKIVIDLTGPEGSAFCLLGYASKFASLLNLDGEVIINEMKAGDYNNLVKVFDKYFGEFVDLYI